MHHIAVDKQKASCRLRSRRTVPKQSITSVWPWVPTLLFTSSYSCVMRRGTTLVCRIEWSIELQLLTLLYSHGGGPPRSNCSALAEPRCLATLLALQLQGEGVIPPPFPNGKQSPLDAITFTYSFFLSSQYFFPAVPSYKTHRARTTQLFAIVTKI